jgi:small GTP-binding protein
MQTKQQLDLMLVGDSGVGKTSLVNQMVYNTFCNVHDLTVGVEFNTKTIITLNGTPCKLRLWDTAGHVDFHTIIRSYYRKTSIFMCVYDITSRSSYDHIIDWVMECKSMATAANSLYILVGNKQDLKTQRRVSYNEAQVFANTHGFDLFFEVCSARGTQVQALFDQVVTYYHTQHCGDTKVTTNRDVPCQRQCCYIL